MRSGKMKKYGLAGILGSAVFVLFSCKNPYMIHDLNRPVYLTGIEIRSNILVDDDPGHPLDQVFQSSRFGYTVTIPYNVTRVDVIGYPEEGAEVLGAATQNMPSFMEELTFTLTVRKKYRMSTAYTVKVKRGLPEATLSGLELYVGDQASGAAVLNDYEDENYIENFVPSRSEYELHVPYYTDHLAFVTRSFGVEGNRVSRLSYEFKNWQGKTIGGSGPNYGKVEDPSHRETGETGLLQIAMGTLPSWYPEPELSLGHIQTYDGSLAGGNSWFGAGYANHTDPDPAGAGKVATIVITVSSTGLNDKVYEVKLIRDRGYAYLKGIKAVKATGGFPGTPDAAGTNRILGSFAPSTFNYEAGMSNDATAVQITPELHTHTVGTFVKIEYYQYFFDGTGRRLRGTPGFFVEWPAFDLDEPSTIPGSPDITDTISPPLPKTFLYDITAVGYESILRTEIVMVVTAGGTLSPCVYRVMVRRAQDYASLAGIEVDPYTAGTPPPGGDGNVFTTFHSAQETYTVNVNAGRTHARITLKNTEGGNNRTLSIRSGAATARFKKSAGLWVAAALELGETTHAASGVDLSGNPWADVELKGRNTVVHAGVSEHPGYATRTYVLNILSKNRNDIILPEDALNDGQVRAVFAEGPDAGLTAEHVLPGEKILLTVKANLGYYVDWDSDTAPYKDGVGCFASALNMDNLTLLSSPTNWKERQYRFIMPDENVEFRVHYRPTTVRVNRTAYVAQGARRGGGYGGGADGRTADSWGTASNDLQAVINSWDGANFAEIWVLRGTYTPSEDPRAYSTTAVGYPRSAYTFGGADFAGAGHGRKDYAFVLRAGLKIFGGFEETDSSTGGRSADAAQKTVLSGEFDDGSGDRTYHVLLAIDAGGAVLDTLTVAYGLGSNIPDGTALTSPGSPPSDPLAYYTIKAPGTPPTRLVSRQRGGGIFNANSPLTMTNVIIRNNKSTAGGGMYTIGLPGGGAARPELDRVEFSSNTALASGGGMLNASSGVDCIPIIENSAFLDNKAIESGGGLYNGNCKPVVTGTRFRGNTAARGGGIFNSGGESVFADIEVIANISQQDGAGIYNQGNSVFYNLDVKENFTDTGSGIGIYNGSSLRITNASIMNNKPRAGGGSGGGLYNGGQAVLTNVTIEDNEGSRGGGVFNGGSLIMANGRIDRNTAGAGGGLYNYAERRVASAVLANVTVDSNNASNTGSLGGGIFNYYEGATNGGADSAGSTNVLLSNVRITRNGGGAMYNHYMRTSDYGINVTFKNCTIADNVSSNADHAGIYTRKERRIGAGDGFPVFLRFHNTALVNNKDGGGSGSVNTTLWEDINGSSGIGAVGVIPNPNPATDDPADPDYGLNRETYEFSYIQGRDLSAYNSNLDGTSAAVNFVSPGTGDYRPGTGSDLIGAASKPLYRSEPFADFLVSELYFKVPHTAIAPATLSSLPIHLSGALSFTTIVYFLGYDLSFNVGDLRLNGNLEGSKAKPRPGALPLDIGAYQH